MPHTHAPPPPTQPDLCPLCAMRRAGGAAADLVGRYSLTHGSPYRCSACDTWLCADCGGRPVPGAGANSSVCSTTQEPESPRAVPTQGLPSVPIETTCIRTGQTTRRRCQKKPADWPVIPGEPVPVPACLAHLSDQEREDCLRARELRRAEQARIWAAGEPERQRLAEQAAAEKRALQETYPCGERRPEQVGMYPGDSFAPNCCQGCDSWLCASCDWVHVATEGAQCATCRPQAAAPGRDVDRAQENRPHYRITLGGLESFDDAVRLLIRAGARYGGGRRRFTVDLPICVSQAEALEFLESFDFGGEIAVKLLPESAQPTVDPGLPEPDLSGLADVHTWWSDNANPKAKAAPPVTSPG